MQNRFTGQEVMERLLLKHFTSDREDRKPKLNEMSTEIRWGG
jgi:hypothetical protein